MNIFVGEVWTGEDGAVLQPSGDSFDEPAVDVLAVQEVK